MTLARITDYEAITGDCNKNPRRVQATLNAASVLIRRRARQTISFVADDVAMFEAREDRIFVLPELPVSDVAAVEFNGAPIQDWSWDRKRSLHRGSGWGRAGIDRLTVTYSHGYDPVPDDVVLAVVSMAARLANTSAFTREAAGPVTSESWGDHSITFADLTGGMNAVGWSQFELDVADSYRLKAGTTVIGLTA